MTYDPSRWAEGCKISVPLFAPPTVVFLNTYTGVGITTPFNGVTYPWGGWATIDLSGTIPADAKAVFLQGILIITHGTVTESADLQINLRPPSSTEPGSRYEGQTTEASVGNGQRSTYAAWVAVEDCKFQFWWNVQQLGPYPDYSAYGVNLQLQAFLQ